jgi:branched-chain amino acid aminotransferase
MPEELASTQEVFITGTAAEVTPVAEIGPHRFQVGQITQRLVGDFDKTVRAGGSAASAA